MSEKQVGQNEAKTGGAKPQRKPVDEKRKIRCAFTGHRPQYLTRCEEDVRVDLENAIMAAIKDGYTTFISGLAYGVDYLGGGDCGADEGAQPGASSGGRDPVSRCQ